LDGLPEELQYAAKRRLPLVFKDVSADRTKYPVLARLVETVEPSGWAEDPTRALLVVMRRAVTALPKETAEDCAEGRTWRQLGRLLFFGSEEDGSLRSYTEYVTAAMEYSGAPWAERTFRRHITGSIREKLATILLAMEQQAIAARTLVPASDEIIGIPVPPVHDTPFIPRLATFFDEVAYDKNLLCVVGEPGTGKTRFVREHTAADNPIWIDATSEITLLRGMERLLRDSGMDPTSFDSVRIKQAFGNLLTEENAPAMVVIDGIPDPKVLDPVIPHRITSRVIVTSCVRPPKDWWCVHIPDMGGNEAAAMAESLLPGFEERDYHTLAAVFGYRPLLIKEGCLLAERRGTTDLQAFCTGMSERIAETRVEAAWIDQNDPTLEVIYREYIRLLSIEAPDSVELLRFLCFVSHRHVPAEFAMSYLQSESYITPDLLQQGRTQDEYEKALERLVRYSLVTEVASGCFMQPLTQRILRGIFYPQFPLVLIKAFKLLQDVDYTTLFEAGWGIFSAAGRQACSMVLRAYLADRLDDDPVLRSCFGDRLPDGRLGTGITKGIEWPLTVSEVWDRCVDLATTVWWMHEAESRQEPGETGTFDWSDEEQQQRLLRTERPGIQGDEARAVQGIIKRLILHAFTGGTGATGGTWDGEEVAFEYDLRSILDRLTRRYQDSPLGSLDLSLFFNERASEQLPLSIDLRGTIFAHRTDSPERKQLEAGGDDEGDQAIQETADGS
jgi:hypothetical protein